MKTNVIEYERAPVKKGDKLAWDFKFSNSFSSSDAIQPANVTVTLTPASQVSYVSPVTVSGLTAQVTFDTTNASSGVTEYLADVFAVTNGGFKKHLYLVLVIEPNS
jgi:hypothetical protein